MPVYVKPGGSYDQTVVTADMATGALMDTGYAVFGRCYNDVSGDIVYGPPGSFGYSAALPNTTTAGFPLWVPGELISAEAVTSNRATAGFYAPSGTKYYLKGRVRPIAGTGIVAALFPFAFGIFGDSAATRMDSATGGTNLIGDEGEGTRDDIATMAVIVDETTFNIQSYNNDVAGNASLTDSTFDALLTSSYSFELIVEGPSTMDTFNDLIVTAKISDSAGTIRTIFNAANPVSTAAFQGFCPFILLNHDAVVENLVYKIEKAA